jgi:ligand-binding SRPBCC domain-containing protein
MTDHVRYVPPFGIIGKAVNRLMIRSKLNEIFTYRKKVMDERYNGK